MTARRIFTQAIGITICITIGFGSVSAGEFFFGGGIASKYGIGSTKIHSQTSDNYLTEFEWSREPLTEAPTVLDNHFQIGLSPEIGYRFSPKFAISVETSVYLPTGEPFTPSREYPGVDTREGEDIQRHNLRTYGGNRTWSVSMLGHWDLRRSFFFTAGATMITFDERASETSGGLSRQQYGNNRPDRAIGITLGFGHEHSLTSNTALVGHYRYTFTRYDSDDPNFNIDDRNNMGLDFGLNLRYYSSSESNNVKNKASQKNNSSIDNRLFFGVGYTAFSHKAPPSSWNNRFVSGMQLTGGWRLSNRASITVSYNRTIPKGNSGSYINTNSGLPYTNQNQSGTVFGGTEYISPDRELLVRSWQANAEVKWLYGLFVQTGVDFITQTIEDGSITKSVPLTSLLGGLGFERTISQNIGWVNSVGYSLPIESKGVALVDNEGITFQTQLRFYR